MKSWKNVVLMAFAVMSSYNASAMANGGGNMFGGMFGGGRCDDRSRFYIEPTGAYYRLDVRQDQNHHRLQGSIWGIEAGFEYTTKFGFYSETLGYWRGGVVNGPVAQADHKREISEWNIEERVGLKMCWNLDCSSSLEFRLYTGSGYLQWHEDDVVTEGTRLIYREWYIPVGTAAYLAWNDFTVGVTFQYSPQVDSTVASEAAAFDGTRLELANKFQYEVELPIIYKMATTQSFFGTGCSEWSVGVVPYWEYRATGHDRLRNQTLIGLFGRFPDQNYQSWGGKLLAQLKF